MTSAKSLHALGVEFYREDVTGGQMYRLTYATPEARGLLVAEIARRADLFRELLPRKRPLQPVRIAPGTWPIYGRCENCGDAMSKMLAGTCTLCGSAIRVALGMAEMPK